MILFFFYAFNRNYNYGKASKDLNVDLLSHPEYIEKIRPWPSKFHFGGG